jgi:hypothetical protein
MAKMGIGGLLLGAAALAAASAVASDSNGNRGGNANKYDRYNTEYDVDGNKLTENEKTIKSIIKNGIYQDVNLDLRECVTITGKVDQKQALPVLMNYLLLLDILDYLQIEKGLSEHEIDTVLNIDYILDEYKQEYISKLTQNIKSSGMNYSTETSVEFVLDELRMCRNFDIYDNILLDDEYKAKSYVYFQTKVMFPRYWDVLEAIPFSDLRSPEQRVQNYRDHIAKDEYRACVMADGRIDFNAFYATLKKLGKLESFYAGKLE